MPVAIKTLLPAHRGKAELERLLIAEARLGATLRHQNLVHVLDLGTDAGSYFICLEYEPRPVPTQTTVDRRIRRRRSLQSIGEHVFS